MTGPRCQDDVAIRERQAADDAAIRALNEAAFGSNYEATLVEDLRSAGLAAVELVACDASDITGHILFSRLAVTVGARAVRALALAPMAVRPDHQRQGIGSALVREGLARASALGWQAIVVLGHPWFYPRFGFSAALARKLRAPFSGDAFMAIELEAGTLDGEAGRVGYPAAFGVDGS
jgi:putative acetyltransferase